MGPRGCLALLLAVATILGAAGCARRPRTRPVTHRVPPPAAPSTTQPPFPSGAALGKYEEGIASWYGHPYHGRQAASGEIYNMHAMTAAHRTLPFGTMVKVYNLNNGQETTVRINDRGPFVEGRIIDLSYAAAQAIRMPGIAPVRLEVLDAVASTAPAGVYVVQVGAFQDPRNAERLKAEIERSYRPVLIQGFDRGDGYFHRVWVGAESSEQKAQELARKLRAAGLTGQTFVVRIN